MALQQRSKGVLSLRYYLKVSKVESPSLEKSLNSEKNFLLITVVITEKAESYLLITLVALVCSPKNLESNLPQLY